MSEIQIKAHDGGTFKAYVAIPETTPAAAIIVIQEIFGINAEMREKCDTLAKQGYLAVCPDLFWRIQLERAFELFGLFDLDNGVRDLQSTLQHLRHDERTTGKVGCIGYCLGGKLAYIMAAKTDIDASVSYYGVGIQDMLDDAHGINKPLLMHIAGEDKFVSHEAQAQIKAGLQGNSAIEIHSYAGVEHAFARGNGMHYNEEAATLANGRTADFLKKNLQ
jgi:carboxymethylenebutenolidase